MKIRPGHFMTAYGSAPELFRESVESVEIEISSFCNRRCGFCPNSQYSRLNDRRLMEDDLFSAILRQLAGIGWKGFLRLHRYNEPLAERDYLLRRLTQVRDELPGASVFLFTNGDYLDPRYFEQLYQAGLRQMVVNCYPPADSPFVEADIRAAMEQRIAAWGLPHVWKHQRGDVLEAVLRFGEMAVMLRGENLRRPLGPGVLRMSDRGGLLPVNRVFQRHAPCLKPFSELQVEVDGSLMPCCELRSDAPDHRDAVLGRMTPQSDLFSLWSNARYVAWRRELFQLSPKTGPCRHCIGSAPQDSPALRAEIQALRRDLGLDGFPPEPPFL